jgi:predicted nucleic acid-binding protein
VRGVHVVFDVTVFVDVVTTDGVEFTSFPSPPPLDSDAVFASCIGIANDGREVSLFLSEHVLDTLRYVLATEYGWDQDHLDDYEDGLLEVAIASGGGLFDVQTVITECADPEDDNILALALDADAELIVSNDTDLLEMSPWRGRPIITPRQFAERVNAVRTLDGR